MKTISIKSPRKATRRTATQPMPQWMRDWYRDSAGGSVIADYAAGNVKIIKAGE